MKGILIKMPFANINNGSNEVEILGENFIYGEAGNHFGIQVNFPDKENGIKKLCFEISEKVKQLYELDKN